MKYILASIAFVAIITVYFFAWRELSFSFEKKIVLKDSSTPHAFDIGILSNAEQLESCMRILPLKLYKEKGLIHEDDFDFDTYDYLISYGLGLNKLKTSWNYAFFTDRYYALFKTSNKRIPVKAEFKDKQYQQAIYIYTLAKKNKYRGVL